MSGTQYATAKSTDSEVLDYGPDASALDVAQDPTCRSLNATSMAMIRDFLAATHTGVASWNRWRSGDGWDSGAGDSLPNAEGIERRANAIRSAPLGCEGQDSQGLSFNDPYVRGLLSSGALGQSGISGDELNSLNEWLGYAGKQVGAISSIFCLTPPEVHHNYGMNLKLGVSAGVGFGAGAKVEVPGLGEMALGCYPKVDGEVKWLTFSYYNNLGLEWSAEYSAAQASVGAECAARFSIGPSVSTSFGSKDLCSATASSDEWYGPGDFTGGSITPEGGVDGGVGVNAGVGLSAFTVIPITGSTIVFNASGACTGLELGGGAGIGASIGFGGQVDVADPEMSNKAISDIGADNGQGLCDAGIGEDLVHGPETLLIARTVYFDTGASDPQHGSHASENIGAIQDISNALNDAGFQLEPSYVRMVVTGHASPKWDSASSSARAADYNQALGQSRADMTAELVNTAYNSVSPIYGWPSLIEEVCVEEENAAGSTDVSSQGSQLGLQETGNRNDNSQQYRRATVQIYVATRSTTRRTEAR